MHGTWNEEAKVGIPKDRRYADQACTATWDDAYILPCVLTVFSLTMVLVVEVGYRLTQRFDAGSGAILSSGHRHVNLVWAFKAALDV